MQLRKSIVLNNPGIKRALSAVHLDTAIVLDFTDTLLAKSPRSRISASKWLGDFHRYGSDE